MSKFASFLFVLVFSLAVAHADWCPNLISGKWSGTWNSTYKGDSTTFLASATTANQPPLYNHVVLNVVLSPHSGQTNAILLNGTCLHDQIYVERIPSPSTLDPAGYFQGTLGFDSALVIRLSGTFSANVVEIELRSQH